MTPDFPISTVRSAPETETFDATFRAIIEDIGSGRWRQPVEAIRQIHQQSTSEARAAGLTGKPLEDYVKDRVSPPKKRLPGILFSGTFKSRHADEIIQHSGLICVDLDKLGDRLEGIRDLIVQDPHTLAAFISPTGTGLKVIFRCDPNEPHIKSYRAAEHYVLEHFGLEVDKSCKDASRMCFASYDPDVFVADDAEPLPPAPEAVQFKAPVEAKPGAPLLSGMTPGDDYDRRADLPSLLESHGWARFGRKGWTRPGRSGTISATWDHVPGRFYVFTDAAEGFEPQHLYRPWHVYAILEHGGDFSRAAKALAQLGYGEKSYQPKVNGAHPETLVIDLDEDTAPEGSARPVDVPRPITDFTYPEDDDPNILLGSDDYLGRGGGMLFVSHAGAGKSSWIMDACMSWGLGEPWMGIRCARPLRSLIIQAEDSDRYIGKVFSSFAHVRQLGDVQRTQLAANVRIIRVKGLSGVAFLTKLKQLVQDFAADLVVINPLYLYTDGDIGRSEFAQPFLIGLDAVNKEEKFAYILVHHTGKPQSKGKDGKRAEVEDWESAYMGFGSSYLANWPRCSALLEPVPGAQGKFLIKLGKGGYNAGVTRQVPHGACFRLEKTTRIPIKHSEAKMPIGGRERPVYYWEHDDTPPPDQPPAIKGGRPKKYELTQFMSIFPKVAEKAQTKNILLKYAQELAGISDTVFRDLLAEGVRDGILNRTQKSNGFLYHLNVAEVGDSEAEI